MADTSLIKISRHFADFLISHESALQLQRYQWSSRETATTMYGLLEQLGKQITCVSEMEQHLNVPTLEALRKELNICTSAETSIPRDEILNLIRKLKQHRQSLESVLKNYQQVLTSLKGLEISARQSQGVLLSRADSLAQQGRSVYSKGRRVEFIGGMLLIPTLGLSKFMIDHGDRVSQSGRDVMQQAGAMRFEVYNSFARYSGLIHTSINIVEILSGMIDSLSSDLRTLSQAHSPRELRKVRRQAINLTRHLAKYTSLSTSIFGQEKFLPYSVKSNITCDQCHKQLGDVEIFFHCQNCQNSDLCVQCYRSRKHSKDHIWTKHSKAQVFIHSHRMCNLCRGIIVTGRPKFCFACDYDLCEACATMYGHAHQHALSTTVVRWYDDFTPSMAICDECWRPGKECGIMYQCLDCYWYFACRNCKASVNHPHGLLRFDTGIDS